jgi:hypothetical protein
MPRQPDQRVPIAHGFALRVSVITPMPALSSPPVISVTRPLLAPVFDLERPPACHPAIPRRGGNAAVGLHPGLLARARRPRHQAADDELADASFFGFGGVRGKAQRGIGHQQRALASLA